LPNAERKPSVNAVVDSSAVLAFALREDHWEEIGPQLTGNSISAVNAAEVVARMLARGDELESVVRLLRELWLEVLPFDPDQAYEAGRIHADTRPWGLSLGDCACLALGRTLGADVLTADRIWTGLKIDVPIRLVR
jgi:PIN domain nuclease of toxin-antitoxin system